MLYTGAGNTEEAVVWRSCLCFAETHGCAAAWCHWCRAVTGRLNAPGKCAYGAAPVHSTCSWGCMSAAASVAGPCLDISPPSWQLAHVGMSACCPTMQHIQCVIHCSIWGLVSVWRQLPSF